eukprot:11157997-Lingulodinium_polyedra.AAC.1
MAYLWAEHFEMCWKHLDFARFGHTLPPGLVQPPTQESEAPAEAEGPVPGAVAVAPPVDAPEDAPM